MYVCVCVYIYIYIIYMYMYVCVCVYVGYVCILLNKNIGLATLPGKHWTSLLMF